MLCLNLHNPDLTRVRYRQPLRNCSDLAKNARFLASNRTKRQRLPKAFGLLPHPHPKPFADPLIGKLATRKLLIQP
jgi:hypothetical protein